MILSRKRRTELMTVKRRYNYSIYDMKNIEIGVIYIYICSEKDLVYLNLVRINRSCFSFAYLYAINYITCVILRCTIQNYRYKKNINVNSILIQITFFYRICSFQRSYKNHDFYFIYRLNK